MRYPTSSLEILPIPRGEVARQQREDMISLYSMWCAAAFGTGEVFNDDAAWELAKTIASRFPLKDNPATTGFDLAPLSNDFSQLEYLFFCRTRKGIKSSWQSDGAVLLDIDLALFEPGLLIELQAFNGTSLLVEGDRRRLTNGAAK